MAAPAAAARAIPTTTFDLLDIIINVYVKIKLITIQKSKTTIPPTITHNFYYFRGRLYTTCGFIKAGI
jgi:hypothetical protein